MYACSQAACKALGTLSPSLHRYARTTAPPPVSGLALLQAYLLVGPQVACYPEYRAALVQHLIRRKLGHWDRALRELTSKALAAIVPHDPAYFCSSILGQLLDLCADPCIEVSQAASISTLHSLLQGTMNILMPPPTDLCGRVVSHVTSLLPAGCQRHGVDGCILWFLHQTAQH